MNLHYNLLDLKSSASQAIEKHCNEIQWLNIFQYAFCKKFRTSENHKHWLDAAKDKYDSKLVEDIKVLLRVFALYLPLPILWTLFQQKVRLMTIS